MNKHPVYDPSVPKKYYDSFGEKEWTRLSRDCLGELLYHVHMDVFRSYVHQDASVLEIGAGAGIFSNENFLHMMTNSDLDTLFESQNVHMIEKRAAGIFSLAGEEALAQAKADNELWDLLLAKEIEFSKDPAYLNSGANFIYVVRKL